MLPRIISLGKYSRGIRMDVEHYAGPALAMKLDTRTITEKTVNWAGHVEADYFRDVTCQVRI
jgi:hypothetical protein